VKSQRDVFEAFGVAAHNMQAFEFTLSNLLAQVYSDGPTKLTRDQVVDLLGSNYEKTMGQLKNELKKVLGDSDPMVKRVTEAVKLRNSLIHNYFRERSIQMEEPEGRESMALELDEAQKFFVELDSELMLIYQRWLLSHGVEAGSASNGSQ
jgi:hypothetical protein